MLISFALSDPPLHKPHLQPWYALVEGWRVTAAYKDDIALIQSHTASDKCINKKHKLIWPVLGYSTCLSGLKILHFKMYLGVFWCYLRLYWSTLWTAASNLGRDITDNFKCATSGTRNNLAMTAKVKCRLDNHFRWQNAILNYERYHR